jgi:(p)ppGpp synthase/HD superfamily hydrolase
MNVIEAAEKLARDLHVNDVRRDGVPYVEHLRRVAVLVKAAGGDDIAQAIAWLHDAMEDHKDAFLRGMSPASFKGVTSADLCTVLSGVGSMTRGDDESYEDYLENVCASDVRVRLVKLCDMFDNIADKPTPKQWAKYMTAYPRLLKSFV